MAKRFPNFRKHIKKIRLYAGLVLSGMLLFSCNDFKRPCQEFILWYDKPARDWMTEALPLGNGYIGVMFFGTPEKERLQFSEESLWAGGPRSGDQYNFGLRNGAEEHLSLIRNLMARGKKEEAFNLAETRMTGIIHPRDGLSFGDYGAQQAMGELLVSVETLGDISNYRRELNLSTGRGSVFFSDGEVIHTRTFFGCYPLKTMVYHFENNASQGMDYSFEIETPHPVDSIVYFPGIFHLFGHLKDNNLAFLTSVIFDTDGEISFSNRKVEISGATNLTLRHSAFTSYANKFPDYRNENWLDEVIPALEGLVVKEYTELEAIQEADYVPLFQRVHFELNTSYEKNLPTNLRIERYADGIADPSLETLYFQYARYLMISSSRPGTLPMHLQGKWNDSTDPPWACDYHTNINLQMLYWPAEVANLSECHQSLFDYLQELVPPGRLAAETFFGTRGWVVNTMNNVYGFTSPGWGLPWGYFPGGAAWLTRHAWEHFEFTQDTVFLKQTAWPLMREAALFWEDYLTENDQGFLVSVPSFSPEHGGISSGASMDHQIAWDLFNNCVKAAKLIENEEDEISRYENFRDRILPPKVGRWGQLQEWVEDLDDPENQHRHVSHLFALYPGQQISITSTPELAKAALTSLVARSKEGTGWSLVWKINLYARLNRGSDAYELLRMLLRPVRVTQEDMHSGGSYLNLLCAHPPFQLDGNMGAASGIAEMLLQSQNGIIQLLPAIPPEWENGKVSGLRARGGFEVEFSWKNGKVRKGRIKGIPGSDGKILFGSKELTFIIPRSGIFKF